MLIRKSIIKIAESFKRHSGLEHKLVAEGKTRWLDIGSHLFDDGFICLDILSNKDFEPKFPDRYYEADILNLKEDDYKRLGKFNLIRMQHVFEHFTFEEGSLVLEVCSQLLNVDGYLLITVPDLKIHVKAYLNRYKFMNEYLEFAYRLVPKDAPSSSIFSIYTHQTGATLDPGSQHKFCYDYEGLEYQVKKLGKFTNIKHIKLFDTFAGIPFTHNRPEEDVCLLAQKS